LLDRCSTTFCEGYFWDRVSRTVCPGWLWTMILLISVSWVARITGVSHWPIFSFLLEELPLVFSYIGNLVATDSLIFSLSFM
jgi:hypothetical protein